MRSKENFFQSFFHDFWKNILRIFSPLYLIWMAIATLLTYVFVSIGFDWQYYQFARAHDFRSLFTTVGLIGFAVPVFAPLMLLLVGKYEKNFKMQNIGFALGQAAFLGLAISSFIKFFTGRPGPSLRVPLEKLSDISTQFNFGLYRGGVYDGWPSSHTAVAFAMSFALIYLFPKNKTVHFFSIIYAFYVGIGTSLSFHWFSDFAAGAILGAIIGIVVGKSFQKNIK
jgi:membrane-associated phospholipid phosphatase